MKKSKRKPEIFEKNRNYVFADELGGIAALDEEEIQNYFSQISSAMYPTVNLSALLKTILDAFVNICRASRGSLYLVEGRDVVTRVLSKSGAQFKADTSTPEGSGSYLGIPLVINDEVKGLVNIYYEEKDRIFKSGEVELLIAFASQSVLSIENARFFESQQKEVKEATELYRATKVIGEGLKYSEVVNTSAVEASKIAGVDRSLIFLLNEENEIFYCASNYGLNTEQKVFFSYYHLPVNRFNESYFKKLRQGEYIILSGAPLDFSALLELFQILPATSCLLVPLLLKEKLIGFIYLDDSKVRQTFTPAQIKLVMTLSLQIAMAIQRARLLAQLEENFNQLRILYHVSTSITGTLSPAKLFKLIVTKASQLTRINSCSLLTWDDARGELIARASVNLSLNILQNELCSKVNKMATQKKKPSIFYILPSDKSKGSSALRDIGKLGILAVPLIIKGKLLGILNCFADEDYRFSEQEVKFFRGFANQATVALENARLYDVVRNKVKELAMLFEVGKTLTSTLQLDRVLKDIVEIISKIVKADAIGIFLFDPSLEELSLKIGLNLSDYHYRKKIKVGEGVSGIAVKTGRPMILTNEKETSSLYKFPGSVERDGLNTIVSLPMKSKGEVIGLLNLYLKEVYYYNEAEISLLSAFADQAAVAIENARLYQEQLKMAGVVQSSLMPHQTPKFSRLDISYKYIPSKELSGDYFDFIPLTRKNFVVSIADVSGKGTQAAVYTARSKYILKALAHSGYEPHKALELLNKILYPETAEEKFISVFYADVDLKEGKLKYSSAGHEPALFYKKNKDQILYLESEGLLIGVDKGSKYRLEELEFTNGDILVLYTDGITEARSKKKEIFGAKRLEKIIKESHNCSANGMAERIYQSVLRFTLKNLVDDFTLLVIKF